MATALISSTVMATISTSGRNVFIKEFIFIGVSIAVSITFVIVWKINWVLTVAVLRLILIHVLFLILFGLIFNSIIRIYPIDDIVKCLVSGIWFCAISVLFYFRSFRIFGVDSVSFLILHPNGDINSEGYVAAAMHVYGSHIFLTGAIFATPSVIKSHIFRFFAIVVLIIVR